MPPISAIRLCAPSWPLSKTVRDLLLPVGHAYLGRLLLGKACCISTQHARREAGLPSTSLAHLEGTSFSGLHMLGRRHSCWQTQRYL